ncbi:trypsin-like peptidase domain-containing protein [Streptomyces sp. NPDC042207]|uniref:trypsin-like peptidase domain-containing protein n=1 Tax=Streptomyces sp. NPDC042207 TaxID=3154331 RepID=UPI0033F68DFA
MNEGKPTKSARPKWWSRSVPPDARPEGTPAPDASADEASDGGMAAGAASTQGSDPGSAPVRTTVPGPAVGDGDYELERPLPASSDFELAQPRAPFAGVEDTHLGAADAPAAPAVPGEPAAPATPAGPGVPAVSAETGADRPVEGPSGPGDSSGGPGERSSPLHDPDPYSTPPYGEPGPWAPAPPVQHPAATPAHSSGTPAAAPHGSPAAGAQPYGPAPVAAQPGAPVPTPPAPPGPPSPPQAAAPQGTPAPDAQPYGPAPVPSGPSSPPQAPADASTAGAVSPWASPEDAVPTGPQRGAPLGADPAHGAPAQAAGDGHGVPAPGAGGAHPGAGVSAGPWGRYDPWGAVPLQQSGSGVLSTEQRHRRVTRALVGGAVVLALVSGALGGLAGAYVERNGGLRTVELPQAGKEPAGRAPDSVAGIAARALPSVVTLHVSGSGEQGTGTGFVLDGLGHVLTNNHVVENAASGGDISVTFSGGQTAKARIVGRDSGYDLAVVQVRGVRGLTPIPLGNSDNVQVGDPVVAIGAPFDLANTVTSGIISAKERPITAGGEKGDGSDVSYVDALQTDAPINPGNSGGPLLDSRGRVVGINSAIRSADTGSDMQTGQAGSIGLGFAIPVNQARRVAEELINHGRASHPVIGVTLDMNYPGDGARVGTKGRDGGPPVTPGGPGAKAGIRAGDVVTAVDGQRVHSGEELIVKTRAHRPGDRLELTVERDGKARKVSLVLGSSNNK